MYQALCYRHLYVSYKRILTVTLAKSITIPISQLRRLSLRVDFEFEQRERVHSVTFHSLDTECAG